MQNPSWSTEEDSLIKSMCGKKSYKQMTEFINRSAAAIAHRVTRLGYSNNKQSLLTCNGKICSTCKVEKSLTEFHKSAYKSGGADCRCKPCASEEKAARYKVNKVHHNAKSNEYYANNKEATSVRQKKYYLENTELVKAKGRQHYEDNKEAYTKRTKTYRENNRALYNAMSAKRRAAKLQATPLWFEKEEVKDVYMEGSYFQMDVDHIVPLQSSLVCGLHCWDNLQLLTPTANSSKGNRHWEDMWDYKEELHNLTINQEM